MTPQGGGIIQRKPKYRWAVAVGVRGKVQSQGARHHPRGRMMLRTVSPGGEGGDHSVGLALPKKLTIFMTE